MMENNFILTLWLYKSGKEIAYPFNVAVTHQSEQVIRFCLTFKGQEIQLEKRLLEKRYPWKLKFSSIQFNTPKSTRVLNSIFDHLDIEIKGSGPAHFYDKKSW